ncbi:hypothetical protein [Arthrobacter sp. Z1-15]
MSAVESAWNIIQHRAESAYLFVASLLSLATGYGQILRPVEVLSSPNNTSLSPALRTFAAVSEFLTGHQWSWIQNTSLWVTERSEVLHLAAAFLLVGAGGVIGCQGSDSLKTKASATLILSWVLVVATGGMSFGIWAFLVGLFVFASLVHMPNGAKYFGQQISVVVVSVAVAALYSVLLVFSWLFGRIGSKESGPRVTRVN